MQIVYLVSQTFKELQILIQILNVRANRDIMKTLLENAKFAIKVVTIAMVQQSMIVQNVTPVQEY